MARSSVITKLPLDRFTRIIGYSPILFNQVTIADIQPAVSCSDPILQYTWQPNSGGQPGRDEIAQAILQAEEVVEQATGYSLLPTWHKDDVIPAEAGPRNMQRGMGWPGVWPCVPVLPIQFKANTFQVIYGGVEAKSVISAGAAIVYTDNDGDGYAERATVTVATTITDINEIALYYPGASGDPAWEIRPIKVTIAGGTATIVFERHQAVLEDLLEALNATGVNGLDNTNFLTTADVYRRYNDPSTMVIFEWNNAICTVDPLGAACQVSAQVGCLSLIDGVNGFFSGCPAEWDADDAVWNHVYPAWWYTPDRIRAWYRAGLRNNSVARPMCDMDPQLERIVSYLALSYLDREWLSCEQMRNLQAHWRTDLTERSSNTGGAKSFAVGRQVLDNPIGTTRAAVYAWQALQRHIIGAAVLSR